jgi:hypothetical protein
MNFAIKLSKNKTFEFDLNYWNNQGTIFSINLRLSYKGDHAGLNFDLTLFGLSLTLDIHDNRHWNYTNNRWEAYPNEDLDPKYIADYKEYMNKIDEENDDMVKKL